MHTAHENLVARSGTGAPNLRPNARTIQTAATPNEGPHNARPEPANRKKKAGDGIRTHDNDVGNVVLYQLSYTRMFGSPCKPPIKRPPLLRTNGCHACLGSQSGSYHGTAICYAQPG